VMPTHVMSSLSITSTKLVNLYMTPSESLVLSCPSLETLHIGSSTAMARSIHLDAPKLSTVFVESNYFGRYKFGRHVTIKSNQEDSEEDM
jgi:hypothetical protein